MFRSRSIKLVEGEVPKDLIKEVRERVAPHNKPGRELTDGVLSRFLEESQYSVDDASKMVLAYIKYRDDNNVDEMLKDPPCEKIFRKYTGACWGGNDKYGHPINWDRVGMVDQASLFSEAEERECIARHMWFNECLVHNCEVSTNKRGKLITRAVLVKDMKNLNMLPNRSGLRIFSAMSTLERIMYPQSLIRIYMINSSWLVTTGWSLLRNFLHEETRNKVVFLGNDSLSVLIDDFGSENVPAEYGGTAQFSIPKVPSPEQAAAMTAKDKELETQNSPSQIDNSTGDGSKYNGKIERKPSEGSFTDDSSDKGSTSSKDSSRSFMERFMWKRSEPEGGTKASMEYVASHWMLG